MPSRRIFIGLLASLTVAVAAAVGCQVETATSTTTREQDSSYQRLKQMLTGDYADTWWWDMRGEWSPRLKLWVVSADPPERPTVLRLSPERQGEPEVTLHLEPGYGTDEPWYGPRVGEEAFVEGIPRTLSLRPFHLTLEKARVRSLDRKQSGPRPAVRLTTEPSSVVRGEGATLQWTAENALSVALNQEIGRVESKGSREVFPAQTTTYTIAARGQGGEASATATVTVREPHRGRESAEPKKPSPEQK